MKDQRKQEQSRRKFLRNSAIGAAGLTIGGIGFSAKSYGRIIGANNRLNFAVVGVHSRGTAHIDAIGKGDNTLITHICDVDALVLDQIVKSTGTKQ